MDHDETVVVVGEVSFTICVVFDERFCLGIESLQVEAILSAFKNLDGFASLDVMWKAFPYISEVSEAENLRFDDVLRYVIQKVSVVLAVSCHALKGLLLYLKVKLPDAAASASLWSRSTQTYALASLSHARAPP